MIIISWSNAIPLRVAKPPAFARYSLTAYDFTSTIYVLAHKNNHFSIK